MYIGPEGSLVVEVCGLYRGVGNYKNTVFAWQKVPCLLSCPHSSRGPD